MRGFYVLESAYETESASRFGAFGVDVFFAISGLLITKLLLDENSQFGGISLGAFYVRRAFRILPPCFLYLTAISLTTGFRTLLELTSSIFFFRNYLPAPMGGDSTAHLWSLAMEEQFYLFWPLLLAVAIRRHAIGSIGTSVAWAGIGFGLWRILDTRHLITASLFPLLPTHFRTDLRLDALLWGCFVGFLLSNSGLCQRLHAGIRQVHFFALLGASLACVAFYSHLTSLWLAMLLPVTMLGTILHPEWPASRLLDHPWFQFVGKMSYSLYLWQQVFLAPGWEPRSELQQFPQNLILVFVAAFLSYRCVEKPCMQFGRSFSARIQSRRQAPAILARRS